MQNAARPTYQFDPAAGRKPSEFFRVVEPTGYGPALNQMFALPAYPKRSLIDPTGLWASGPEEPIWRTINALSAWQNSLLPPDPPIAIDEQTKRVGRQVFERAGCIACHAVPGLSNHDVIPIEQSGTNPKRARIDSYATCMERGNPRV
jgi:hypothetical protein